MTVQAYIAIEKEIETIIFYSIEKVKAYAFSDYVLLLAKGDYERLFDSPEKKESPYVIETPIDEYMDYSRRNFLANYLNYSKQNIIAKTLNDVDLEHELNIQLMIYSHVWESHLFLKSLERIAAIQNSMGYIWESTIEKQSKSKYIENQIISLFKNTDSGMYNLLLKLYNNDYRNAFAHSSYYIDIYERKIEIKKKGIDAYSTSFITLTEWEDVFWGSVLLSYHLCAILDNLKCTFIHDYGTNPIVIERPLKAENEKKEKISIYPTLDGADTNRIRFSFGYDDSASLIPK